MKIVFDARVIRGGMTGVGIYARSLLEGLARIDAENEYSCLFLEAEQAAAMNLPENFRAEIVNTDYESHPAGEYWLHFQLPRLLARRRADAFHGPAFAIPWRGSCPRVVTIHDLTVFIHPETYPWKFRAYLKWVIRHSVQNARRVIAVSQSTRNDLLRVLGAPDEKIRVVPEAAGESFRRLAPEALAGELKKIGLAPGYILFIGTLEPRKGLETLLEAYRRLPPELRERHPLALAGRPGWKCAPLLEAVNRARRELRVIQLDHVAPEALPALYSGAALLAYPSRYEGFGLPLLEAMACGAPVICSNASSLPEVAGGAALLCTPGDAEQWTQGLTRLLTDAQDRLQWIELGLRRARDFSWDAAARRTLEVYRELRADG